MSLSIFNFNKYPNAFLTALKLLLITIISGVCFLNMTDNMPAPMLSNSFSLDEKFRYLRLNKRYQADYVVLGSSTGLANIHSETMMSYPKINQNYLNYSAWGLNITGKLYYWNFLKEIVHPKVMIIPIDLNEFNSWEDKTPDFKQKDVKRYLDGANPVWFYLKYHKNGFVERLRKVIGYREINDTQLSTKFDQAGGVPLNVTKESRITRKKWKDRLSAERYTEQAYIDLDQLLSSLKQKGIIAVIVEQPLREHYRESESEFGFIEDHWDKVSAIAKQNRAYFFNMQDILPEDASLFSDSGHMNWWAAEEFTKKLLKQMEHEGIFEKADAVVLQKRIGG